MTSPSFQVVPWNGYKAALSLSFDDGELAHLDFVIPQLVQRRLAATFYLIARRLTRQEDWKKAATGQEIGNHSVDHKHARDLTPGEEQRQVEEAKNRLEELLDKPVPTFAYPFTEISPGLRAAARAQHFLSRGGNLSDFYMTPESEPDWDNLSSQVALSHLEFGIYQSWADQSLEKNAWTIAQFHGIEGEGKGWQPIPKNLFLKFLDYLFEKRNDLWIAPIGEVGAYWRAQKILEKCKPQQEGTKAIWTWKKPMTFPTETILKLKLSGESSVVLKQNSSILKPDSQGLYNLSFDQEQLTTQ